MTRALEDAISTITPAEVGGLVERLLESAEELPANSPAAVNYREAATALAARDAELAAEHQRYVDANEARIDAEALSRTGAVTVDRQRLNMEISKWATDSDLHITIGDVEALHLAILSALEPAAPEGRREPAGWSDEDMARHWIDRYAAGVDASPQMGRILSCVSLARPAEQAVTEAMVRIRDYADKPHADRYVIRNMAEDALKAAIPAVPYASPIAPLKAAMTDAREINWVAEARELKHAIADNAYPAQDGTADIDNHALPLIETTLRDLCERYVKSRIAAGFRILGPDEVEDVQRVVEIANRNEWSAEGDRLARALGRKA